MLRHSICIIVLVIVTLSNAERLLYFETDCEDSSEIRCNATTCISSTLLCNGRPDCANGVDEINCDYHLCKSPSYYQCKNEKNCLEHNYRCDGEYDCRLGDDEHDCDNYVSHHEKIECNEHEFECTNDTLCLPKTLVCDGVPHCMDNSDEILGCTMIQKICDGFLCKNNRCVDSDWVCDGFDDCRDGSDELYCIHDCTLEHQKFLCHDNDSCVDILQTCDGIVHCTDGSDEGDHCKDKSTDCGKLNCSEQMECTMLPTGAVCVCPHGFVPNHSTYRCEDVDECQRYGICSQGCVNTPGSYECTCVDQFHLDSDNRTCVSSSQQDALLLYAGRRTIMGMFLKTPTKFTVQRNLNKVIGVAYDGQYIYWTDIFHKFEGIFVAARNGSNSHALVSFGILSPEDITIDWLTGNIYFSDGKLNRIVVCTYSGSSCIVLYQMQDHHKPRGLVLYPQKGLMFWSDWGSTPQIVKASMDGDEGSQKSFVTKGLQWPNGLTLDWPNNRLYWVDALTNHIGSILLDGTDQRIVLSSMKMHPFGIAIFEDRIYWSDWTTKSLQSCDKFTGKNFKPIVRDHEIFDVHIYHKSIQPYQDNGCANHSCSHVCLLSSVSNYTCACPDTMVLSKDKHQCKENESQKQQLLIAIGSHLITMEHHLFTAPIFGKPHNLYLTVDKMEYNSLTGDVFIASNADRIISSVNINSMKVTPLISNHIGHVTSLAFDDYSNNLYWADSKYQTIELLSMSSMQKTVVRRFIGPHTPIAIAVIPEEGKMFVALETLSYIHLDILPLNGDGAGEINHKFTFELGTFDFAVDRLTQHVMWVDGVEDHGKIQVTNFKANAPIHKFEELLPEPTSVTVLGHEIFWTCAHKNQLFWMDSRAQYSRSIEIEKPASVTAIKNTIVLAMPPIVHYGDGSDHKCNYNLGGCSHICASMGSDTFACLCPTAMSFSDHTNRTCIPSSDCGFKCSSDSKCLPKSKQCDGETDCKDGSDEYNCSAQQNVKKLEKCPGGNLFECANGDCIPEKFKCDFEPDCSDGSDEVNCVAVKCPTTMFACKNGLECVDTPLRCDAHFDCVDHSDEENCAPADIVCGDPDDGVSSKFQCTSNKTICLEATKRCNGRKDCPLGEDEMHCDETGGCGKDEFECANKKCIRKEWVCDVHPDCDDNSDEHDCMHGVECGEGTFDCKNGMCIELSRACDGTHDCPKSLDEGGMCGKSCEDKNSCDHVCHETPTGPVCSCKLGYRLGKNGKDCDDIDECVFNSPCSQICENTPGSFQCKCFAGFSLYSDGMRCKAVDGRAKFVYSKFNQIRLATKYPSSLKVLWSSNESQITGMDLNIRKNLIYFTTADVGKLYEINLETQELNFANNLGKPSSVAVDWATDNVYTIDENTPQAIRVCHIGCAYLLQVKGSQIITAIAVDAVNKFLFYSVKVSRSPQCIIYRSNLDGTHKVAFKSPQIYKSDITALTCDHNKKVLYYTDIESKTLRAVNYVNEENQIIALDKTLLAKTLSLSIFENTAYIVSSSGLVECKLYGRKDCQMSNDVHMEHVDNVVIWQSTRQPSTANVCATNECSLLCVPSYGDRNISCLCDDGSHVAEREPCHSSTVGSQPPSFVNTPMSTHWDSEKAGKSGVVAATVVFLCLAVLAGIGYIWYKKKLGRGKFNVSMHFENSRLNSMSPCESSEVKMFMRPQLTTSTTYNELTIQSGSDNNLPPTLVPAVDHSCDDDDSTDSMQEACNYSDDMTARLI